MSGAARGLWSAGTSLLVGEEVWSPRPAVPWLIENVLPEKSLGMMFASGSARKSWLLLSLALAVASGEPWLGKFPTRKSRVLYLDWENNEEETTRRARGLAQIPIPGFELACFPNFNITDAKFATKLAPEMCVEYGLIFIDSLTGGSSGVDENSSKVAEPLKVLKRIAGKAGASVFIIHHSRKPGTDKNTGETVVEKDARHSIRGSGALYNALDVALSCSTEDESSPKVHVSFAKMRSGPKPSAFDVVFEGQAPGRVTLTTTIENEESLKKIEGVAARLLHALKTGPLGLTSNDLIDLTKSRRSTSLEAIKLLVANGSVKKDAEGRLSFVFEETK